MQKKDGQVNKRILMISDHGDPLAKIGREEAGGQNIYVRELSDHLLKKGYEVYVFTRLTYPRSPRVEISKHGFKVIRIKGGPIKFIPKEQIVDHLDEFIQNVEDYIKTNHLQFGIIHSHYWISGMIGLILKQKLCIPLVQTFHSLGKVKHKSIDILNPMSILREEKEKEIVKRADKIIATCPEEKKQLLRLYDASPEKIVVIPAGVNLARFKPCGKVKSRKKLNISVNKKVLLFVGRLVAQKGIPTLIKAVFILFNKILKKERQNLELMIVGGSTDRNHCSAKELKQLNNLQKLIKNYHLEKNVKIIGQVPNRLLPWYYSAADICIVPSRYEPFGIVPLESMACATPVVASRVGGLKFSVKNIKTGLHAKPNDPDDFAYKIRLLLQNPKMRNELGKNGLKRIHKYFLWEQISEKILETYLSLFSDQ